MLFCLTCFFSTLFGQNVLVFTNKKNGKEKIIKQGKKIKIFTKSDSVYKGFFTIKNDSLSIIDKKFSLDDIEMIRKVSTEAKVIGGALTVVGGLASIFLVATTIQMGYYGVYLYTLDYLVILVATKGILMLTKGISYKKPKWDYSVRTVE